MIRLTLPFVFFLLGLLFSYAKIKNNGIPFIHNYPPDIYRAESQNLDGVQDERGLLYFANKSGVLEFDGVKWSLIKIRGDQAATALTLDQNRRILVGAKGDLGFLKANHLGEMTFHSIKSLIPAKDQNFKEIKNIFVNSKGVIFLSDEKLFLWNNHKIRVFSSPNHFDQGFMVNHELYLREWDKGLLKFDGNTLTRIKDSELFALDQIAAMLPLSKNKILIISKNKGCTVFNTLANQEEKFKPFFNRDLNDFLVKHVPTCGIKLGIQQYALGTSQNGIIIIDQQGKILQHLNRDKGLLNNTVYDLFLDHFQNLWLSLDEGIAHIEVNSPFTLYNELLGIKGRVINTILHKNRLYVGTSSGVFYRDWRTYQNPITENLSFKAVKGSEGYAGVPFIFEENLIYSHTNGVLLIQDTIARELIANEAALSFSALRKHPHYLLVAKLNGGLSLLEKKENTWLFKGDIPGIDKYCYSLQEDGEGNIWFSDYKKGIYKLRLREDLSGVASLKLYDEHHGLPPYSRNSIICLDERPFFITRAGLYRYVKGEDRFEADQALNKKLFQNTYAHPIVKDQKGNLWYIQFGNVGVIKAKNSTLNPDTTDFLKLRVDVMSEITPIDDQHILFGTSKGLFHYSPHIQKNYDLPFYAHVRQVFISANSGKDSLIFGGTFSDTQNFALSHQPPSQIKTLPYIFNNLRFVYSSAWYEDSDKTLYQCYLAGLDQEWSPWTSTVEKSYTNLPEGTYTFYIRAKNIYGKESKVAAYQFEILPPWHRTIWAYLTYIGLIMITVFLMLRLNTIRLRRKNIYLAKEIDKGLAEIRRQNEQLESKNKKIEKAFQDIKLLGEIGKDITAHLSVEKIIDTAYANINMLMDATVFGIGIYNKENKCLEFMGVKEKGETLPVFRFSIQETQRLAIWSLLKKREVFLNNFSEEYTKYVDEKLESVTKDDAQSIIYVPLMVKERAIGVITVQSFTPNAYTHYHLDIIKNLAIHTSIALENAKSYQKLEELNLEKNHLISIVAHDLRNPLHNIFGLSSVIKLNSENLSTKQSNYLDKILQTTARINDMIDKILDMNAIESNSLNIQWEKIDLGAILLEAQENLKDHARRKNIQIHLDGVDPFIRIQADRNYTLQIFENLISNALKFSPPNEYISVSVERLNGKVRTKVIDCGPGISTEDQQKLFGKFQRLSAKPTGGESATGLGLSIVKKYVEAMNGEVWCESKIGHGTTFFVDFRAITEE